MNETDSKTPLSAPTETEFQHLRTAYFLASNDLSEYRQRMGFIPGVRVRCKDSKEKTGTIPEYGPKWVRANGFYVPVDLDSGLYQLWDMAELTVVPIELCL